MNDLDYAYQAGQIASPSEVDEIVKDALKRQRDEIRVWCGANSWFEDDVRLMSLKDLIYFLDSLEKQQ